MIPPSKPNLVSIEFISWISSSLVIILLTIHMIATTAIAANPSTLQIIAIIILVLSEVELSFEGSDFVSEPLQS